MHGLRATSTRPARVITIALKKEKIMRLETSSKFGPKTAATSNPGLFVPRARSRHRPPSHCYPPIHSIPQFGSSSVATALAFVGSSVQSPTAHMTENFSTSSATTGATDNPPLMAELNPVKTTSHAVQAGNMDQLPPATKAELSAQVPGQVKQWDEEFIKDAVNKTVDDVIRDAGYTHEATSMWVNQIVEIVVRALVKVDRDNKYIGMCLHVLR